MDNYNNNNTTEKRRQKRRLANDRRVSIRFNDSLGRRSGIERRLDLSTEAEKVPYEK